MPRRAASVRFWTAKYSGNCAGCAHGFMPGARIYLAGRGSHYCRPECLPPHLRSLIQPEQHNPPMPQTSILDVPQPQAPRPIPSAAGDDLAQQLARAIAPLVAQQRPALDEYATKAELAHLIATAAKADGVLQESIGALSLAVDALEKRAPRAVEIRIPERPSIQTENEHPNYPDLIQMLALPGSRIYIGGPTGSGKTTAVERAAKALNRPLFILPPVSDPYQVIGYRDAHGVYQETAVSRWAATENAVLLIDEVDASHPSAVLALNMPLANGIAVLPHEQRPIPKGNSVVCTANTWGLGASADYVGRTKLDAAFLGRFPFRLTWPVDADFETRLVEQLGGKRQWSEMIQACRANAAKHGIRIIISPRDTLAYATLRLAGLDARAALDRTILAPCADETQRSRILEGVSVR